MANTPIYRVVYLVPSGKDSLANQSRPFDWGERDYFYNCHRDGGDYKWFSNNVSTAEGNPLPESMTPSWTFDRRWNPESTTGPSIMKSDLHDHFVIFFFSEPVTVIGTPILKSKSGAELKYESGGGTNTLRFDSDKRLAKEDLANLQILGDAKIAGTNASVHERDVNFETSLK